MNNDQHAATRYFHLTRKQAGIVLTCTVAFLVWCLFSIRGGPLGVQNTTQESDVKMYRRVINRVQLGQGYYESLGSELRKGGYASQSPFNWRSPFHLVMMAIATESVGRWVLAVLAVAATLMATLATKRAGGMGLIQAIVTALAVSECFLFSLDFHLFPEVWAGVLIVISISAYEFGWWSVGVGSGILALFLRELVLPYALVSLVIALWQRRRSELLAWTAGLGIWTAYFLIHLHVAKSHIVATDIALPQGWLQFGGPRFLVTTTRMSLLLGLPEWVAAVCLPVMLLGIAGWRTGIGNRVALVVGVYMAAFSIVGLPVNSYWGAVTNPLLAFGVVWSMPALLDLVRALGRAPRRAATGNPELAG